MTTPSALTRIRVIDLATSRAELAGRVLADLGAEVIKVEPRGGCEARALPPFAEGTSLYWASVGLGKRSVVLDLEHASDRATLTTLIDSADILVESFDPGVMYRFGLGYAAVAARNPGLVYASVTPFGQTGPAVATPAIDLTIEASGGLVGMQGDGDRPPLAIGLPQASFHAGVQAAADILIALYERNRSGLGQHLDVSMQAAMVWTLMNATGYPANTGGNPPGSSEFRNDARPTLVPGMRAPRVTSCRDGYVIIGTYQPGIGERTLDGMIGWLTEEGAAPPALPQRSWLQYMTELAAGTLSVDAFNCAYDAMCDFVAAKTKRALLDGALERKLLLAPIYDIADLRADPQLADRGYWTDVAGVIHPGPFARLSATPIRMDKPAPRLGADQALLQEPRAQGARHVTPRARAQGARHVTPRDGVFAGLKVADFAWVGVGPIISKALADQGATVIHVESEVRTDLLRSLPPFKNAEPGINRSQFFANFNTSKQGLRLELTDAGDLALARKLAAWADVVVESFTPGTMARYGLDYTTLAAQRSDLVMLSTCMRGQTGPERHYTGFGNQGAALAGLAAITGWPDRAPVGPWGAYTDFITPRYGVAALAAALLHRDATGQGQYIDLSQIEAGIQFHAPLVLDYTVNGRVAGARGNVSDYACPHGTYRTRGVERYVAIGVATRAQWEALTQLVPFTQRGAEFGELATRIAQRESIEAELAVWCAAQDAFELAARLQRAGVPSYAVLRPTDLFEDPQLRHRQFFVTLDHPVMGPTPYDGPVTHYSRTPPRLRAPAPLLGQHTTTIRRWLAEP
jgi:crotonobetainyl-CoA:carnitine CoA-transferase CaiB-like acyl-CoA transferase